MLRIWFIERVTNRTDRKLNCLGICSSHHVHRILQGDVYLQMAPVRSEFRYKHACYAW